MATQGVPSFLAPAVNSQSTPSTSTSTETPNSSPAFDSKQVTVIFVLGGPGAGKQIQAVTWE